MTKKHEKSGWEMSGKLSTLLTMASEVSPGDERAGNHFWCHGRSLDPDFPGEPPFETMVCTLTLLNSIAAHPDLMEYLNNMAEIQRLHGQHL